MYITRNHIIIPLSDKNSLLVHTLTGKMYVILPDELQLFESWIPLSEITPNNSKDYKFFSLLEKNGFLSASAEQEKEREDIVLKAAKKLHEEKSRNQTIAFVLTYGCNFKCPYCYEHAPEKSHHVITKEMVDTIFRIHDNNIEKIMLYGGEPLQPGNAEIIHYIFRKAPKATYSIISNGYHLKDCFELLSRVKIDNITITLDGEEEIHNKTRIHQNDLETFRRIMEGIDLYLKHQICIKIRMNISQANLISCNQLKEQLITRYHKQYESGLLLFEMQPVFQIRGNKRRELEQELYYPACDSGAHERTNYSQNTLITSLSPLTQIFSYPGKFVPRYCNCDAEQGVRFYDVYGYIYSCILALGNEKAAIGQFYPKFTMKESGMHCRNIETIPQCRDCRLRFLCGGGCANTSIDENGNVLHPNCAGILQDINYAVPALYERYISNGKKSSDNCGP